VSKGYTTGGGRLSCLGFRLPPTPRMQLRLSRSFPPSAKDTTAGRAMSGRSESKSPVIFLKIEESAQSQIGECGSVHSAFATSSAEICGDIPYSQTHVAAITAHIGAQAFTARLTRWAQLKLLLHTSGG
jgi:hypothetical protein